jgi:uncharacterized protein with ParB-like and HNH nuclease domain/predicted transport protein
LLLLLCEKRLEAVTTNFLSFLQGTKQFVIPIYQHNYSWTVKQCEQLWNDIVRAALDPEIHGHFLGSIVYITSGLYHASTTVQQLLVIDGQQRLTTLSLLLFALSKALRDANIEGDISQRKIINYYIINSEEQQDLRFKIVLTRNDKDTFFSIIESHEYPVLFSHHMVENYKFFEEKIRNINQITLNELFQGISKLIIVDISLDRNYDNPQLIFESLNSTGLDLSQADLIRNYMLMGLEPKEQERIYNTYWHPMERSFEQDDYTEYFDRFMRDFLTIKTGQIPNKSEIYSNFKSYVMSRRDSSIGDIIENIHYYSKIYVKLIYDREDVQDIRHALTDIRDLDVEVSYPFLLEVFDDYLKGQISQNDLLAVLQLIESYVFRRAICLIPTKALNKIFANLSKEIDKNNYLESLKAAFILKEGFARFPTDQEFKAQFPIVPLYSFRRISKHALRKLENIHHRKEPIDIENYTIEHIMPQNKDLSPTWRRDLGENWQEIHQKYLDTVGNLTITGYNSELGDLPFLEKRDRKGGFASSPLTLNHSLSKLDHWNGEEIEKRASELTSLAIHIWPAPYLENFILERYRQSKQVESGRVYTEEDRLKRGDDSIKRLYGILKNKVLQLGDNITVRPVRYYIGFARNRNFIAIRIRRAHLLVDLVTHEGFIDSKDISVQAHKAHYGGRIRRVRVASEAILNDLVPLIRQTYEKA